MTSVELCIGTETTFTPRLIGLILNRWGYLVALDTLEELLPFLITYLGVFLYDQLRDEALRKYLHEHLSPVWMLFEQKECELWFAHVYVFRRGH